MRIRDMLYVIWQKLTAENYPMSHSAVSGIGIYRWGRVVQITLQNVQNLPAGSTTIATLPERFRPYHPVYTMILNPNMTTKVRASVNSDGVLGLYNYGTAITASTNASVTMTYVAYHQ